MEVTPQSPPAGDFNFDSASTSPYTSCPSSPKRFGNYFFSAPNSPTRAAAFYRDHFSDAGKTATPFAWEEKPGTPIPNNTHHHKQKTEGDFEFHFIGPLERHSLSAADELFDGGKIRLLKPPPELQNTDYQIQTDSPKSAKNNLEKTKEAGSFTTAKEETPKENNQNTKQSSNSVLSSWYNKLKIKDLLLFRSISEGHKEKYGRITKRNYNHEDVKNSSFRSTGSGGSVSSRRRVSAHEWHYTANRAAAAEMRKKSFLPYKQGLLGCLGFNVPVVNELSRGFGSYVMRE